MKAMKLLMAFAMLVFGSIGLFVRHISMTSAQISLLRGAVGAVCLFAALAFGGISAFADATWHGDGFENSLTVEATDTESMSEDIAKAGVVVDIYRVASAEKDSSFDTYNYTWEAPFDEGPVKTEGLDANAWNKLAADAAKKLAGAELAARKHVDDAQALRIGERLEGAGRRLVNVGRSVHGGSSHIEVFLYKE